MRKSLLVGLAVAAPILFASGASACGWGCDCAPSYGYSYGYSAPRVYGYSSYRPVRIQQLLRIRQLLPSGVRIRQLLRSAYGYGSYYRPGVRFYGARTYGWRAGVGVRRVGWGGRRRW